MRDVQRFLALAQADQEQRSRQYADSTAIALKIYGGIFTFAALCMFGWPALFFIVLLFL